METEKHPAAAFAEELGLIYTATFVPFSKSRSAEPDPKPRDLQINWKIELRRQGRVGPPFTCDYQEGIGHLPKETYDGGFMSIYKFAAVKSACETGRKVRPDDPSWWTNKREPLDPPKLEAVLHCLVLDYAVLNYAVFEDWALEFGYDADSRAAERSYRECLEQALKLRAVFSEVEIAHVRELLADY